jgi:hypothetical protein
LSRPEPTGSFYDGPLPVKVLRGRFRELLKIEVAGTLDDAGLVEAEMRVLFAALGG